jgi:hypothetical protein
MIVRLVGITVGPIITISRLEELGLRTHGTCRNSKSITSRLFMSALSMNRWWMQQA